MENEREVLILADLGQKLLNAIAITQRLGHNRLRHSLRYIHTDDPAALLVKAALDGPIDPVEDALDAWLAAARS